MANEVAGNDQSWLCQLLPGETVIDGPHVLFEGSFEITFYEPDPRRHASTLFKATYKRGHPLLKKGKAHPQSPPLHLHFNQAESFAVLSGRFGTTANHREGGGLGAVVDEIHDKASTISSPHTFEPWTPHKFWPIPDVDEDTSMLLWATPEGKFPPMMDDAFFVTLLSLLSDVSAGKVPLDLGLILLNQHESESTAVIFPGAWWLGPLRWFIPWALQATIAAIARWQGKKGLVEEYVRPEDWKAYNERKKTL
ncbi:hypothetical protein BX600DRAFT_534511 [Xylariales sp. PMI_506]|nr:hypothetical protein BX600DRAFT_534511 [Xylariales sp. PMI_506]